MIRTQERTEADKPKRGIMDLAPRQGNLYAFDPRLLTVEEGWNQRLVTFSPENEEDLALARSIAEVGVKQPLTVYMKDGVPVLTDGHRRLAATLYAMDVLGAEVRSVPVQTETKYASEADRVLSQIVRNSGKPLAPIEKASVFAKLMDLGWSETEIAKKVGLSRQHVVDLLELRAAPRQLVERVESGEVSATLAVATMKSAGSAEQAAQVIGAAVEKAKAEGRTRATARHVERERPARDRRTFADGVRFAIERARHHALTIGVGNEQIDALIGDLTAEIAG